MISGLFLSEEDVHRTSEEVEVGAELVLKEAAVRFADVLREIAEESERRRSCRELGHILDLDVFALPCRWRIVLDLREHDVVEL